MSRQIKDQNKNPEIDLEEINKEQLKLNENLMSQHLCCMIMQHHSFPHSDKIDNNKSKYLNRYVALYVLFKTNLNHYHISDDVAKCFYM